MRLLTLALALVLASVASMASGPQTDLVVRPITIIDVANRQTRSNQRILVRSGRIVAIEAESAAAPPAAKVADGAGKFLIPGLSE